MIPIHTAEKLATDAETGNSRKRSFEASFGRLLGVWRDPRFVCWALLVIGGFAYVAGILCHRPDPFASRRGGYAELGKLLLSIPLLYLLGPRHNLEPFSVDVGQFCRWNVLGYVLPFFVALHWLFLQHIRVVNYSLTPEDLSHMHPVGQVVFICAGSLILGLIAYHLYLAGKEKILVPYLSAFLGAVLLIAGITWVLQSRYYLHLHHYFLFGFFIPFTRFKNPVSLICQAICAGVYVEGVSEWGMASLWCPRH